MKKLVAAGVLTLVSLVSAQWVQAQGFDSVRSDNGKTSTQGKIVQITAEEVTVDQAGVKKTVPTNTIYMVVFSGEPAELSRARVNAYNGAFDNARVELDKVNVAEVTRPEVAADVEFFKGYCAGKLALGGSGALQAAQTALMGFVTKNKDSFHYYETCELLGDLAVAQKKYDDATRFYTPLGRSSYPDLKMRAAVLVGRASQAKGDHADALAKFDFVLGASATGPEAEKQVLAATLGKAISLAATDKVDPAIKLVNTVIEKASPEEVDLNARANNALGTCYVKAGKNKEALRAFLKVDLIYNGSPEAHAEALANLTKLWTAIGKEDRAQEAMQMLKERYPESPWAKSVGS